MEREMTREHRIIAVVIGALAPLVSWACGSGELSYGMYAHASEARLELFALDEAGVRHRLAPSALALGARPSFVPLVAGTDHWRTQPRRGELRAVLPDLGRRGCAVERGSQTVELLLEERAREGQPIRTTRLTVACGP